MLSRPRSAASSYAGSEDSFASRPQSRASSIAGSVNDRERSSSIVKPPVVAVALSPSRSRNRIVKEKNGTTTYLSTKGRAVVRTMRPDQWARIIALSQDQYPEDYDMCYARAKAVLPKTGRAGAPVLIEAKAAKFLASMRHDAHGDFPEMWSELLTIAQAAAWARKTEPVLSLSPLEVALIDEHSKLAAEAALIVKVKGEWARYERNLAAHKQDLIAGITSRNANSAEARARAHWREGGDAVVDPNTLKKANLRLQALFAQQSDAWLRSGLALFTSGSGDKPPELPDFYRDRSVTVIRNGAGPKPPLFEVRLTAAGRARIVLEAEETIAKEKAAADAAALAEAALLAQREADERAREENERRKRFGLGRGATVLKVENIGIASRQAAAASARALREAAEAESYKTVRAETERIDLMPVAVGGNASASGSPSIARLRSLIAANRSVGEAAAKARALLINR